ncbi:Sortilin, neurotensin receptor 3 [Marivirga sericea]|uniref:Sortilin, neurotensin receptor 3 n=1 Tax=Marivirga sericea TaxID=1028 RepID=A0A1X7JYK9_9BACT|nr:sialidase family protein [Marivirga sericea]SMG33386.1 Sortilin, neurotensin receptor 3 [Marivirga sericea]
MKRILFSLSVFLYAPLVLFSQVKPTDAASILKGIQSRKALAESSDLKNYPARNVGPVIQGARIVDIAVNKNNLKEFYIAYASGGLYHTLNNGISFKPIFDNVGALTLGDIALAPSNENIIYVGTGENNSSRSSYAGSGIYKTTDKGRTWEHIGLPGSQHIGRIVVHPEDPNTVWVAAMGGLYSDNEERGVYKTIDGGKNWKKVLYVDDKTGAIDLIIHPQKPDVLWASMWERKRYAWNFIGNGSGSGIYTTADGGENWNLSMEGMEDDKFTGRIGLDISLSNPDILYALVDYQKETKKEKAEKESLSASDFLEMSVKDFIALNDEELDTYLKDNSFPKKYNAVNVKKEVKAGSYKPQALSEYLGDANQALFDTDVKGAVVYKSEDQGKTWQKPHDYDLSGVYYTYGYYFGEVRIATQDPETIYALGVPLVVSRDGGETFGRTDSIGGVHADHHAMWINPEDDEHIILGNDGGLYISYDGGATWDHKNSMSVGQFYTVNVDMEEPYNIYGGLQDNGTMVGSSRTVPNVRGRWESIFGGDGMFVNADPRNNDVVYVGYQFGNYFRINRETSERIYITPQHNIGEDRLRFNWRTPVVMSHHNPDIIYIGAQKVYRSLNQGNTWTAITGDLTDGGKEGNVPYGTVTEIAESPLNFGTTYFGTDDGNVWLLKEGQTIKSLNNGIPEDLWVSSIHPSSHDEATVYLSLTGYRQDNFNNYVYKSTNYGQNWTSISGDLPHESVNVIYEDTEVAGLLYIGTDHGLYTSFNNGDNWQHLGAIPNVATYDLVIHPRDLDLIVGTHGRSIYVMDVEPLHKIVRNAGDHLVTFGLGDIRFSKNWGEKSHPYSKKYVPNMEIAVFHNSDKKANLKIEVLNEEGKSLTSWEEELSKGYQSFHWNCKIEDDFIAKGKYKLKFVLDKEENMESFEVK